MMLERRIYATRHLNAAVAEMLCSFALPAQQGQRLGPVVDLTAIANTNPLYFQSIYGDLSNDGAPDARSAIIRM